MRFFMVNALIGAISCGRCGAPLIPANAYCTRCGVLSVVAAPGAALGPYSGMLGGVVTASATRRYWSVAIDLAPAAILAGGAVAVAAGSPDRATGGLFAAVLGVLLVFGCSQLLLLLGTGRTLGRWLLGLRTVDDLSGSPVGARRLLSAMVDLIGSRSTMTADLRRGRDPHAPARNPLGTAQLAQVSAQSGAPTRREGRRRMLATDADDGYAPQARIAPFVTIVLDNDQSQQVDTSLLIGRRPDNRTGDEVHPLFAWTDLSRTMSKSHALVTWSGTLLWVTDLGSANGTTLVTYSGERRPLLPGQPTAAAPGWRVELGDRHFDILATEAVTVTGTPTPITATIPRESLPVDVL
ncbi:FHA domain-containing protein [Cryobacterium sp. SO2]|uniref:FHA domain-containing protein n=1 Tax=Cryobacterium sp. SO2 TaxID=1897060 RepID=UPI00223CA2FA|nr:FHA domain-containing protein [Cryobacterium sp. SO2]WEO77910.1 FHA domain-containing protein [Cryobacterium sp. SO2]